MCTHRPSCPAIDEPGAESAQVVAEHTELGWSMLCNGLIVTGARKRGLIRKRNAAGDRRAATRRAVHVERSAERLDPVLQPQ
jgi:Family of unknown function (DUF5999)